MSNYYFLIVEDEKDLREAIIEVLPDFSSLNISLLQAGNGKQALELIENYNPIAVMSDIGMPVMNGLDFLVELRKRGYETPFLVVSAFGDKSNTVHALRLGAFDFLDKPFSQTHLIETVTNLIHLGLEYRKIELDIKSSIDKNEFTKEDGLKKAKGLKLKAIMAHKLPVGKSG